MKTTDKKLTLVNMTPVNKKITVMDEAMFLYKEYLSKQKQQDNKN